MNNAAGTLGAFIRAARDQARLSQGQLAAVVGVNPSYIARIESGQRAKPAADVLQRMADALGINSGELLAFLGVRTNLPNPEDYFQAAYGLNEAATRTVIRFIGALRSESTGEDGPGRRQDGGTAVPGAGSSDQEEASWPSQH